jgi:CheY-like chemotaxis protein
MPRTRRPRLRAREDRTTPPGVRVLVVDRDEHVRDATTALLETLGFATVGAATEAEASAWLRDAAPPCLIVLDAAAAHDAGPLGRRLRTDPRLADVPVVVTTDGIDGVPHDDAAPRIAAVLSKPIDLGRLEEVIARHCPSADWQTSPRRYS